MQAADQFSQLRAALAQWTELNDAEWIRFSGIFRPKSTPARIHIARPGDHIHDMVFVTSGLLRYYFIDQNGEENNKAFIAENSFAGPLASASLQLPIYYGVEALEQTEMLAASFADLQALYDEAIVFERLGRKFAEMLLMRKELRTRSLLMQTASERYRDFAAAHPDLLDRVPQYHIASYLGITDVSLSRLKRSLAAA